MTVYEQTYKPKISVRGVRGWCLKYVDDAGNAPNRRPTARLAYEAERSRGRVIRATPPKGVWVVGFFELGGEFAAYGHVVLMKHLGSGKYDIRDSEVAAGARSKYTSINSVLAWFANYQPHYLGWSPLCDGRRYVKEETMTEQDKKDLALGRKARKGHWEKQVIGAKKLAVIVAQQNQNVPWLKKLAAYALKKR